MCVVGIFPVCFSEVFLFVFICWGFLLRVFVIILKENSTVKCPVSNYRFEAVNVHKSYDFYLLYLSVFPECVSM